MAGKMRQLLRLLALYTRMDWNFLMRDKRTGFICVLCDWMSTAASISGILLLAVRFDGIGGLTADEVLWMLSFYTLAGGFTWMVGGNYNALHISRRIGRSQVDHMIIQPCPMWMQLMTEGFMPFSGSSGFLAGIILTVIATSRLGISVTPDWLAMLFLYCIARLGVSVAFSYIMGSAAFYHPVACEELSSVALDMLETTGKYPLVSLPSWLQAILTTVLPVGLMSYLPSMILLQKIQTPVARVWPFAVVAALLSLAGLIFRKGLKHYATQGCPRYKDMGFRC